MEFNINATDAGAALRTGTGEHTLSIGDHDVTLMINGDRVALQRLALAIAVEAGLKIRVDGYIDGNDAFKNLTEQIEHLRTKGTPGVMHKVDAAFHKLAITERDHARVQVERLTREIAELKGGKS